MTCLTVIPAPHRSAAGILSIRIFAMPHSNYIYELLVVIDAVDNPINSNPNSPQVSSAFPHVANIFSLIGATREALYASDERLKYHKNPPINLRTCLDQ